MTHRIIAVARIASVVASVLCVGIPTGLLARRRTGERGKIRADLLLLVLLSKVVAVVGADGLDARLCE